MNVPKIQNKNNEMCFVVDEIRRKSHLNIPEMTADVIGKVAEL